jgi:hypothetical protein
LIDAKVLLIAGRVKSFKSAAPPHSTEKRSVASTFNRLSMLTIVQEYLFMHFHIWKYGNITMRGFEDGVESAPIMISKSQTELTILSIGRFAR